MNKVKIIFESNVDQVTITNDLQVNGGFPINVQNNFAVDLEREVVLTVLPTDTALIDALMLLMDSASFQYMSRSVFWAIRQTGSLFDFSQSYFRDNINTAFMYAEDLSPGQELIIRFEIPSFSGTQFRDIILYYATDFNPAELEALEEIGIVLTGNGSLFSITNTFETKVSFVKPNGIDAPYAIDYNNANQITMPS